MYAETVQAAATAAMKKVALWRENPGGYFVASLLAGAYVGVGVFLSMLVGTPLAAAASPWKTALMGASFAVALSLVIFAGAELFTGNNLFLPLARWRRLVSWRHVFAIWGVSYAGNLLGSMSLAALLTWSGVFEDASLLLEVAAKKMQLPVGELMARGILCNWLVCLAVWCSIRMTSESGKLIMIFWCLYAFVASGFEHSVANMTVLSLALFLPHPPEVTWLGMGYNLLWVTLGNIIGGMVFVGGAYWVASRTSCMAAEPAAADSTANV
jgi:nitrite transporter NirC